MPTSTLDFNLKWLSYNSMKLILIVWAFCVLISYVQANVNFKTPEPTPVNKSEDSIWYRFGPRHRHAPYVEAAQFPPIIHPKAPWLVLGFTSVYYLLNHFTPFLGRLRLFGHLLHMLMIGIPVESTLVKFNLGALLNSIGERLSNEWIPESLLEPCGVPGHQSPKCVLGHSQGPAWRSCHSPTVVSGWSEACTWPA
ncbi:hypothetical protein DSO57_1036562 [Entomophthora muscae]|uniref:Uncharacterized protein n=1 Tax=Entomophthora muscae TaxID=34485 RepID=A0ACC2S1A8_9FUNG|nr:hypothetical protein DSO57_1036562 [Entomophthora muscae]